MNNLSKIPSQTKILSKKEISFGGKVIKLKDNLTKNKVVSPEYNFQYNSLLRNSYLALSIFLNTLF